MFRFIKEISDFSSLLCCIETDHQYFNQKNNSLIQPEKKMDAYSLYQYQLHRPYKPPRRQQGRREPRVLVVDVELAPPKQGFSLGSGLTNLNLCASSIPDALSSLVGGRPTSPKKTRSSKILMEVYGMVYLNEEKRLRTKMLRLDAGSNGEAKVLDRFVFDLGEYFDADDTDLAVTVELYDDQLEKRGEDAMVGDGRESLRSVLERVSPRRKYQEEMALKKQEDEGAEIVECGADVEFQGSARFRVGRELEVKLKFQVWKEDFPRAKQLGGANWAMSYFDLMGIKDIERED